MCELWKEKDFVQKELKLKINRAQLDCLNGIIEVDFEFASLKRKFVKGCLNGRIETEMRGGMPRWKEKFVHSLQLSGNIVF